ncbi:unnamed protein product [Sphenostylis stenocarpa]|uniref:Uncharacterized protein n=1 Tax=Sphenostylis stenocarpa TaxID=92480 RepID=A0AA86RWM2_9FABA|nr:unnamed protein product [Sphenostylis stenocarpa]
MHKFAEKKFVRGVGSGSKLRNKVVALMDYNLSDLIGNGTGEIKSETSPKDSLDDVDISLICKRFPSITLGSAPRVDLYDGTTSCSDTMNSLATENFVHCFSDSSEARWVQSALSEEWPSLYGKHSSVASSTLGKDDSYRSPMLPDLVPKISEEKSDQITGEDSQMKVGMDSQSNPTPSELFLDNSISCIPGLSKRHYRQLDNCGFHTLRKLLLHFPRSYANLQNGHAKIDDGQYLIFVGKVLSSRIMGATDHYEMREYNIDVLEDGKDLSIFAKERPYPIYPSKGGLNPNFLRDTIARLSNGLADLALQALPVNVDPIPKDIAEQFGLLNLHDDYRIRQALLNLGRASTFHNAPD